MSLIRKVSGIELHYIAETDMYTVQNNKKMVRLNEFEAEPLTLESKSEFIRLCIELLNP